MNLSEALGIRPNDVVSLVGGGGKTTLMFALARELSAAGRPVITTTTTKMGADEPALHNSPCLLWEDGDDQRRSLREKLAAGGHVTLAAQKQADKLIGLSPELVDKLAALRPRGVILIEADGARHHPLKAPAPYEPVIPSSTTLVVPIVGLDALDARLDAEKVFRLEIAARLTGLAPGSRITDAAIVTLITHPQGLARNSPAGARIVPFLNKTDLLPAPERARALAQKVLAAGRPRITRVVLGQAQSAAPEAGVVGD